jgi:tetratricopeptide (TPR) repeat protein
MAKKPARAAPPRAPFDYGPLAVAAAAVVAFLPALSGGFVWDDFDYVKNNPILHAEGGAMLARLASLVVVGNYHPLTMASFVLDNALAGPGPLIFHVTNVALHAANAVLVGWLLAGLGARRDAAWAGALLWAVHPLRVESVAWISGRKDVLSTFFFLWASLLYLRHARAEGAARRSYAYTLVLFACAVLSKATAVAFVPVAFLFDWFVDRPVTRKTLLEKLPFAAVALGAGWMAIRAQATAGALPVGEGANFPGRVAIACYGLAFYVVKTVAPWGLSALYPYPSPAGTLPKGSIVAVVAVALGSVFLVWLARKARFAVLAAGFFLATVALVLQLFPVGGAVAADRYAYLPAVGFSIAIAFAIGRAPLRRGLIAAIVAFVVGLAGATWVRCAAWHDAISLWNDVLTKYPDAALAHQNRGVAFAEMGNHRAAIADYDAALAVNPRYADALANRGGSKADLGELDAAFADLQEAIRIDPARATYRFNLGLVLGDLGRWDEALASLTEAIRLKPDFAAAYLNRALALEQAGRAAEGVRDVQRAKALGYPVSPAVERRFR